MGKKRGNSKKGMVAVKSGLVKFYNILKGIERAISEGEVEKVKVVEDSNYIRIYVGPKEHRLKKGTVYIGKKKEILEEFLKETGVKVEKKVLEPFTIEKYEDKEEG